MVGQIGFLVCPRRAVPAFAVAWILKAGPRAWPSGRGPQRRAGRRCGAHAVWAVAQRSPRAVGGEESRAGNRAQRHDRERVASERFARASNCSEMRLIMSEPGRFTGWLDSRRLGRICSRRTGIFRVPCAPNCHFEKQLCSVRLNSAIARSPPLRSTALHSAQPRTSPTQSSLASAERWQRVFLGSLQCVHMSFGAEVKWRIEAVPLGNTWHLVRRRR